MEFPVGQSNFVLPDEWIKGSGFIPYGQKGIQHYPIDDSKGHKRCDIFIVKISEINPNIRTPIFKDGTVDFIERTARERTVDLLIKIQKKIPLYPITVKSSGHVKEYRYKLYEGCLRLHCSIAAGFTHIPAVLMGY
jgi:hypothetical protein